MTAITDAKTSAAGMNDRWRETHRRFGVSVSQVWIETATATHPLSSAAAASAQGQANHAVAAVPARVTPACAAPTADK